MRWLPPHPVTTLSLALLMAVLATWSRSYWSRDSAQWGRAGRTVYIVSDSRTFLLQWMTHQRGAWPDRMWVRSEPSSLRTHGFSAQKMFLYFNVGREKRSGNGSEVFTWHVVVPQWTAAIVTAVLPAWWLRRWRQKRHSASTPGFGVIARRASPAT